MWCIVTKTLADVMPCIIQADSMPWQMLLPYDVVVEVKPQRQMLSPLVKQSGRCYCHILDMWQMVSHKLHVTTLIYGRCYCQVADGIATRSIYFNLSSEVFIRTSSHLSGRWYLPIFLFRDGLLTLIYRASLMFLMRFWSSLPTMLKLSMLMLWPVML